MPADTPRLFYLPPLTPGRYTRFSFTFYPCPPATCPTGFPAIYLTHTLTAPLIYTLIFSLIWLDFRSFTLFTHVTFVLHTTMLVFDDLHTFTTAALPCRTHLPLRYYHPSSRPSLPPSLPVYRLCGSLPCTVCLFLHSTGLTLPTYLPTYHTTHTDAVTFVYHVTTFPTDCSHFPTIRYPVHCHTRLDRG